MIDQFFEHSGIPRDAPWFRGKDGLDASEKLGEALRPVADRIQEEWFSPNLRESRRGVLKPWWTEAELQIVSGVRERAWNAGLPFLRKAAWPLGQPFAAVITHDVDIVHRAADFGTNRVLANLRARLPQGPNSAAREVLRVAKLDRRLGVPATFFFLCGYPQLSELQLANVLTAVAQMGFEIGLHATPTTRDDGQRMTSERLRLEALCHRHVLGTRIHLLNFDPSVTWANELEAGLGYDSTFAWNEVLGYRAGASLPFRAFDPRRGLSLPLLELPMAYMDWTDLQAEPSRDGMVESVRTVLTEAEGTGGLAVLNFHNTYLERWGHRVSHRAFIESVRALRSGGAWLATARDCVAWWNHRAETPLTMTLRDGTVIVENPGRLLLQVWPPDAVTPMGISDAVTRLASRVGHSG